MTVLRGPVPCVVAGCGTGRGEHVQRQSEQKHLRAGLVPYHTIPPSLWGQRGLVRFVWGWECCIPQGQRLPRPPVSQPHAPAWPSRRRSHRSCRPRPPAGGVPPSRARLPPSGQPDQRKHSLQSRASASFGLALRGTAIIGRRRRWVHCCAMAACQKSTKAPGASSAARVLRAAGGFQETFATHKPTVYASARAAPDARRCGWRVARQRGFEERLATRNGLSTSAPAPE
jgi:hypothetical protein